MQYYACPKPNQFVSTTSAGDDKELTPPGSVGAFLMDGSQGTKRMTTNKQIIAEFLPEGSGLAGGVRVRPTFTNLSTGNGIVADILRRNNEGMKADPRMANHGVTFTSNRPHNDFMTVPLVPSQVYFVPDHEGQGSYLRSETLWNPPIGGWRQVFEEKQPLPKTVSNATTNLVSSSSSRKRNVETTDNDNQSRVEPTDRPKNYVEPTDHDVLLIRGGPVSSPLMKRKVETTDNDNQSKFQQTNNLKTYVEPTDDDVLLGRGGRTNHHPGNHRYHEEKLRIYPRYKVASKKDKTSISQELVDIVHAWDGRFLKLEEGTEDQWYEVPNNEARRNASQAFRDVDTMEH